MLVFAWQSSYVCAPAYIPLAPFLVLASGLMPQPWHHVRNAYYLALFLTVRDDFLYRPDRPCLVSPGTVCFPDARAARDIMTFLPFSSHVRRRRHRPYCPVLGFLGELATRTVGSHFPPALLTTDSGALALLTSIFVLASHNFDTTAGVLNSKSGCNPSSHRQDGPVIAFFLHVCVLFTVFLLDCFCVHMSIICAPESLIISLNICCTFKLSSGCWLAHLSWPCSPCHHALECLRFQHLTRLQ